MGSCLRQAAAVWAAIKQQSSIPLQLVSISVTLVRSVAAMLDAAQQ